MSKYRIQDVRGRFGNPDGSWGQQPPDLGVVLHYAGTDVASKWWDTPLQYVKHIANLHSQPGRFAPGWTFAGAGAYAEYIFGTTVIRVMNLRAWTPHAGNLQFNKRAVSLHIPIGPNQLPKHVGKGTMLTALRRADDHLKAQNLSRQWLKGHSEVGQTLCPGQPVLQSIANYRQGADLYDQEDDPPKAEKPATGASPVQSDSVFRVLAGSFAHKENADSRSAALKKAGFGESWVYKHGNVWRVQNASFSDPVAADELVVRLKAAKFEAYALAEKK